MTVMELRLPQAQGGRFAGCSYERRSTRGSLRTSSVVVRRVAACTSGPRSSLHHLSLVASYCDSAAPAKSKSIPQFGRSVNSPDSGEFDTLPCSLDSVDGVDHLSI